MKNDLISRSALLEKAIEEKRFVFRVEDLLREEVIFQTVYKDLASFILSAPAVDAGPKWISVEDRLPDSQSDVLVVAFWHECWQTMIGWHSDSGEKWRVLTPHGEREPGGVTHWMPLPELPKEG